MDDPIRLTRRRSAAMPGRADGRNAKLSIFDLPFACLGRRRIEPPAKNGRHHQAHRFAARGYRAAFERPHPRASAIDRDARLRIAITVGRSRGVRGRR